MSVSATKKGVELTISFDHPRDLGDYAPKSTLHDIRTLHLLERNIGEVPESDGRTSDLQSLFDRLPELETFTATTHTFVDSLSHPKINTATLCGAIAFSKLNMPRLSNLDLHVSGDAHGVASPFAAFAWLLTTTSLPNLTYLDARGLDVEVHQPKMPAQLIQWATSSIIMQLTILGLPGQTMKLKELKNNVSAFAHLDVLVISQLRSATAKNPIGGNVIFEDEFPEVGLDQVRQKIDSLPRLQSFKPTMTDADFASLVSQVKEAPIRFGESPLASTIGKFCKKGQWERVRLLLETADGKAPNHMAFMNVRETTESHVRNYMTKHPTDAVGEKLLAELIEQNRY